MKTVTAGLLSLAILIAALHASAAKAEEGMWPLQQLPTSAMRQEHGVQLTPEWLTRVRNASVRLSNCSATFVSADGLVLTNEHCVRNCLAEHSSRHHDLIGDGYLAPSRERELQCSTQVADVLLDMEDVTSMVTAATAHLDARAANVARKQALTRLEQACETQARRSHPEAPARCESVALYAGGQYFIYRYRRYTDLRLVFAPELAVAGFGGDPDNFQFPRWDLDVALLRAYDADGKPAHPPGYLHLDFNGPKAGEPVLVVGNPGSTYRELTVAQLLEMRDIELPRAIQLNSELRGRLIQFGYESTANERIAQAPLMSLENSLKVRRLQLAALDTPEPFDRLERAERDLHAQFTAREGAAPEGGDPWEQMDRAQQSKRQLSLPYAFIEGGSGFDSRLFTYARTLVRAAAERSKPNVERLREYTDSALPRVEQTLRANVPIYPNLEQLTLSFALTRMREFLGPDYPLVKQLLAEDSPERLSEQLVTGSRLASPAVRMQLWAGGAAAVNASDDPMIQLARRIDPAARALRQAYEDRVEAPMQTASEQIARVRFAATGTMVYPDANFTLRLNAGVVQGWQENGAAVAPVTQLAGLFERARSYDPFALPKRWLVARQKLDPQTPLNVSTTNDIVGGNSGSPLLDAQANILGLIFDGNIHSVAGAFWYDGSNNRAVAVDTAAIIEALRVVYDARALLHELGAPDS